MRWGLLLLKEREDRDAGGVDRHRLGIELHQTADAVARTAICEGKIQRSLYLPAELLVRASPTTAPEGEDAPGTFGLPRYIP